MKTRMNIRRGQFAWKRQADLNYGEGWALANGFWNRDNQSQFQFSFGAYGWTKVRMWADHYEDAFEIAVEWLDDHAPGHLTTFSEDDYKEAAEELGLDYQEALLDGDAGMCDDLERIRENAEADCQIVSHTTLKHGTHVDSEGYHVTEIRNDRCITYPR